MKRNKESKYRMKYISENRLNKKEQAYFDRVISYYNVSYFDWYKKNVLAKAKERTYFDWQYNFRKFFTKARRTIRIGYVQQNRVKHHPYEQWCYSGKRLNWLSAKRHSIRDYLYYRTPQIKDMMPNTVMLDDRRIK